MQFVRYHVQAFSYHLPNSCSRHLKFTTSSYDWLPGALLKDVSNSFNHFSWRWWSIYFFQTSLLLKFRMSFLFCMLAWWLLWKFCPKLMLSTCPRVVFIKFQNKKRFLSNKRCKKVKPWLWHNNSLSKLEILPFQQNQFYPATFSSYWDTRFTKVTYWDETPVLRHVSNVDNF